MMKRIWIKKRRMDKKAQDREVERKRE